MLRRGLTLLVVCTALASCNNRGTTLSGTVTYEGQLVAKGRIELIPTDGNAVAVGADIVDGKYTIADLTPGPRLVQISAERSYTGARSTQELADQAAAREGGRPVAEPESPQLIPPSAEGNNVTIEITTGTQRHDFTLTKPK